jgi:hypothetical protein
MAFVSLCAMLLDPSIAQHAEVGSSRDPRPHADDHNDEERHGCGNPERGHEVILAQRASG